jgi:hypothetical protein
MVLRNLSCQLRAVRYRRLALAEEDKAKAALLLKLADESDRGVLCTAKWLSTRPFRNDETEPEAAISGKPD